MVSCDCKMHSCHTQSGDGTGWRGYVYGRDAQVLVATRGLAAAFGLRAVCAAVRVVL